MDLNLLSSQDQEVHPTTPVKGKKSISESGVTSGQLSETADTSHSAVQASVRSTTTTGGFVKCLFLLVIVMFAGENWLRQCVHGQFHRFGSQLGVAFDRFEWAWHSAQRPRVHGFGPASSALGRQSRRNGRYQLLYNFNANVFDLFELDIGNRSAGHVVLFDIQSQSLAIGRKSGQNSGSIGFFLSHLELRPGVNSFGRILVLFIIFLVAGRRHGAGRPSKRNHAGRIAFRRARQGKNIGQFIFAYLAPASLL